LVDGTAGALAEVTASPLGLWLLRVVHIEGRRDPQSLVDPGHYPDAAAIQNHLLEELIPAAVRSRPPLTSGEDPLRPRRRHDPDHVRRWLTTLAVELRDAKTRDWRWWQLARHTLTIRQRGLGFGLLGGLLGGLVFGPVFGLVGGLVLGLVGGLAGLIVGDRDAPAHADFRLRGRTTALGSKLMRGLVGGLLGGLVFGLPVGLVFRLPVGLKFRLMVGLIVGLTVGLISFAASPSIARRASSPVESQRGDRRLTVLGNSMIGLVGVLVGGLLGGPVFGVMGSLVVGLMGGLIVGLVIGLVGVLIGWLVGGPVTAGTCWPAFVLASLWLGARRRLPVRLMGFLDNAHRLGLLRIVGPVYQFRHATLQDHLAPPTESITATTAAPSTLR
jgi:hypothetical protein